MSTTPQQTTIIPIEDELRQSYLDYAMSVIVGPGVTRCARWFKTGASPCFICNA